MKKPAIKRCPAPGCKAHIPRHMEFCLSDFFKLPGEMKDQITKARDKRDTIGLAKAVNAAINFFINRQKELKP